MHSVLINIGLKMEYSTQSRWFQRWSSQPITLLMYMCIFSCPALSKQSSTGKYTK